MMESELIGGQVVTRLWQIYGQHLLGQIKFL